MDLSFSVRIALFYTLAPIETHGYTVITVITVLYLSNNRHPSNMALPPSCGRAAGWGPSPFACVQINNVAASHRYSISLYLSVSLVSAAEW